MNRGYVKLVIALVAAWALGTAVHAQDKKPGDKPTAHPAAKPGEKPSGGGDEMAAMMEAYMKAATPGEYHAKLKPLAGKWTYTTKHRMSADAPWNESTGKAEYRWILGGRILVQEVKGDPSPGDAMMGGPFEGFGLTGYDNITKKYWSSWGDIMGTGMMTSTGTVDASGKVFTYSGEHPDPMTGKMKSGKSIMKVAGDDKIILEMYDKGHDGKEFMSLEVTYARQK